MTTVKHGEWPDAIYTRTICTCGERECGIDMSFEADGHYVQIGLEGIFTASLSGWNDSLYQKIWWRIKNSLKILFIGEMKLTHDFVLEHEHFDEFVEVVNECSQKIKKYHEKLNNKENI